MKPSNLLSAGQRTSEIGLVWREVNSGGGASQIEVPRSSAVRVRAAAGITISFDGVLSATMISGEILVFNSGNGKLFGRQSDLKNTVTLAWSGACFIQLGMESQEQWESDL